MKPSPPPVLKPFPDAKEEWDRALAEKLNAEDRHIEMFRAGKLKFPKEGEEPKLPADLVASATEAYRGGRPLAAIAAQLKQSEEIVRRAIVRGLRKS